MLGTHLIYNGTLIPTKDAHVAIDDIATLYGFGVYESLRLKKGQIFFLEKHLQRLFQSAHLIGLRHTYDEATITNWVHTLVEKNAIDTANIKIIFLGGTRPSLYIFLLAPKFVEKKEYREGISTITFLYERFMPQAKTLNMLPSYMAYMQAKEAGAFDALFINRHNHIVEGSRTNFFVIKNNIISTPPVTEVLDGITRQGVIACAKEHGYDVEEKSTPLSDVFSYDVAFLTNTSSKIVPIRAIDGQLFSHIASSITMLRQQFDAYLKRVIT